MVVDPEKPVELNSLKTEKLGLIHGRSEDQW